MAYTCKPDNELLREALDAPDGSPLSRHRAYIERVNEVYPHTVAFREMSNESTCVLYALDLFRDPIYRAIARNFDEKIFAGRAFMEWLINGRLKEVEVPTPGCLSLYLNGGNWQHVGIVSGPGRVISKWGTFPVYEHDVCELPSRYGTEVRYFCMPGPGEPLQMFLEYAKTQGISDADIARIVNA